MQIAEISISIGETIDALADVRRSDGALKNGIVTPDSLAPGLVSTLTAATGAASVAVSAAAAQAAAASAAQSATELQTVAELGLQFYNDWGDWHSPVTSTTDWGSFH